MSSRSKVRLIAVVGALVLASSLAAPAAARRAPKKLLFLTHAGLYWGGSPPSMSPR